MCIWLIMNIDTYRIYHRKIKQGIFNENVANLVVYTRKKWEHVITTRN